MIVQTINLTKRYGTLVALNNLNLQIEDGECFGYIGPNGAGKTTTIRILATLLQPTWGEARVCGHVIDELMGGSPDEVPDRYRWGDPTRYPGIPVPQLIMTGKHDAAWKTNGRRYYVAAVARGDSIQLVEAPESGHFEVIDPGSSTWPLVLERTLSLFDSP